MKITLSFAVSLICIQLSACNKNNEIEQTNHSDNTSITDTAKMKITIGSAVFTATLNNNATATAFKAMLPLTITMSELNGNEKFYYFPATLPTNALSGGNILAGDLMLYGNNCLVLFYEGFSTSYSYTKIGRIADPSGLGATLSSGSVTVKFVLE